MGNGTLGQMMRFVLPDGYTPRADLVARIAIAGRVEVWDGKRWEEAVAANPMAVGIDPLAGLEVPVPRRAVVDGQVFLRVTNFGGPMMAGTMTMSERR